jgi:hypothetical protein
MNDTVKPGNHNQSASGGRGFVDLLERQHFQKTVWAGSASRNYEYLLNRILRKYPEEHV